MFGLSKGEDWREDYCSFTRDSNTWAVEVWQVQPIHRSFGRTTYVGSLLDTVVSMLIPHLTIWQ